MTALMADLHAIPNRLRHSDFAELRRGLADISNFVVAQHREGAVIGYRYPGQFKDHIVEGADGERIAASIAVQEAARPGLIVVHGLFTSSRFDYVRQIAVRAFYEWGFNVAALDLRSFGMTELTSPAPSAGWKGLILSLAAYMRLGSIASARSASLSEQLRAQRLRPGGPRGPRRRDLRSPLRRAGKPGRAEGRPRDHPATFHRAFGPPGFGSARDWPRKPGT
jgi:hypothetical protein